MPSITAHVDKMDIEVCRAEHDTLWIEFRAVGSEVTIFLSPEQGQQLARQLAEKCSPQQETLRLVRMIHARHADSDGWLTREDCHRAADELPGTLAGVMVLLHLAADDMDRPVKIEDILATCERILNNG